MKINNYKEVLARRRRRRRRALVSIGNSWREMSQPPPPLLGLSLLTESHDGCTTPSTTPQLPRHSDGISVILMAGRSKPSIYIRIFGSGLVDSKRCPGLNQYRRHHRCIGFFLSPSDTRRIHLCLLSRSFLFASSFPLDRPWVSHGGVHSLAYR